MQQVACPHCATVVGVQQGQYGQVQCGACQNLFTVAAPAIPVAPVSVPAEYGKNVAAVEERKVEDNAKTVRPPAWVGGTYSCCSDCSSCCVGTFCFPCVACYVGCDAYERNGKGGCSGFVCDCCIVTILAYIPIIELVTCICCPSYAWCCWHGHVLARFRHKYSLPELEEGKCLNCCCKGSQSPWCFNDCYQAVCPCSSWCTLCLMLRQKWAMDKQGVSENVNAYEHEFAYTQPKRTATAGTKRQAMV